MVGNQGAHDIHIFKLVNRIDLKTIIECQELGEQCSKFDNYCLERIYVYKHGDASARILGVNVQYDKVEEGHSPNQKVRIYILSEDNLLNCLQIAQNQNNELEFDLENSNIN